MKEVRFFYAPQPEQLSELPQDEAMHALRVLRLKAGDELYLMDGQGCFYRAEVTIAATKHCMYQIKEKLPQIKTWNSHLHLAIAPTKMLDRIEWMTEKITEIGFDEITFLKCKFSERKQLRTPRLEKIMIAAMKQSRKAWKPTLNEITTFGNFIKQHSTGHRYIAHCYTEIERKDFFNEITQINTNEDVTVLVGPEGDFAIEEVQQAIEAGYVSVTLGNNRLRTETAGLMSVAMMQMIKRK